MKRAVEVILVFDIGKTNKKYILFDGNFTAVEQGQCRIAELVDDDGDPEDDLEAIEQWIWEVINTILHQEKFHLSGINFSTYGASLVHLDRRGRRTTHFYNYLKAFPYPLYQEFTSRYNQGGIQMLETGSPGVGLINAGFQLYWLKYRKPEIYRRIRWSLHFPQYLSYLLTGIPVSEFTSLGCHTALWNYHNQQYDHWVTAERIDAKLPPLVSAFNSVNAEILGQKMAVGVGIHDSSAALLPYLSSVKEPFVLISTGTWCVSLNPVSTESLTPRDMENGCLYYMTTDGRPVIAHRLFLGYELDYQLKKLSRDYQTTTKKIRKIKYHPKTDQTIREKQTRYFRFAHLGESEEMQPADRSGLTLKEAWHQLMAELTEIQLSSVKSILKGTGIKKIIVDGGFIQNQLYLKMLARRLGDIRLYSSRGTAGSALGAGIALKPEWWSGKLFKSNFRLKRISIK